VMMRGPAFSSTPLLRSSRLPSFRPFRAEFRAHRKSKTDVLASFQEEWNAYLSHLKAQKGQPLVGAYLTDEEVRRLVSVMSLLSRSRVYSLFTAVHAP